SFRSSEQDVEIVCWTARDQHVCPQQPSPPVMDSGIEAVMPNRYGTVSPARAASSMLWFPALTSRTLRTVSNKAVEQRPGSRDPHRRGGADRLLDGTHYQEAQWEEHLRAHPVVGADARDGFRWNLL